MIRECQVLPSDLGGQIKEQREAAFVHNDNPFFKANNVEVGTKLVSAKADLLYPPAIQYGSRGDCVEPNEEGSEWGRWPGRFGSGQLADLNWKMTGPGVGRTFLRPAEWPRVWAVVVVQNVVRGGDCEAFCQNLVRKARERGLTGDSMDHPIVDFWSGTNMFVEGVGSQDMGL
jgi:hypothetical protein